MRIAYGTIINNILRRIPPAALPEATAVKSLCDIFLKYFVDKIESTRSKCSDKVLYVLYITDIKVNDGLKPIILILIDIFQGISLPETAQSFCFLLNGWVCHI